MRHRLAQAGNFLLQLLDHGIEERNLRRIIALLVLAEPEEIGFVLRPPAMKKESILGNDRLAELFHLIEFRAAGQCPPASDSLYRARDDRA